MLQRENKASVESAFAQLAADLKNDPHCPDSDLQQVAAHIQADDLPAAAQALEQLRQSRPHLTINHLLEAEVQQRLGNPEAEQDARDRYKKSANHRAAHVLPWAAGTSLMDLGLERMADAALTEGALKSQEFPRWAAREMAQAYALLANSAYDEERMELAWNAYFLSSQIEPNTAAYNRLAFMAFKRKDYRLAIEFWGRSVKRNDNQAGIHSNLGQVALQHSDDALHALRHLIRATQLDPRVANELKPWIERARQKATQ